eukprot:647391-Pelagomonas_calceolata.AAC.1
MPDGSSSWNLLNSEPSMLCLPVPPFFTQCMHLLCTAQGVKKVMPEGSNMWGSLTTESFTPWLEFDFIYHDAWDNGSLGKTRLDFDFHDAWENKIDRQNKGGWHVMAESRLHVLGQQQNKECSEISAADGEVSPQGSAGSAVGHGEM